MKISKLKDYKNGWFLGNFDPSTIMTSQFEVGTCIHKKGDKWPVHYHKIMTEITLIIKGKMIIQDIILQTGDVFVIEPYEIADPLFLEDTQVVVIKTPSVPGDKYISFNTRSEEEEKKLIEYYNEFKPAKVDPSKVITAHPVMIREGKSEPLIPKAPSDRDTSNKLF